jgi:hypothetical protein
MLQLDMTGYWDKTMGRKMGITKDLNDPDLTSLLRLVVDEYTANTTGRLETSCAYACSGIPPLHSPYFRCCKLTSCV